MKSNKNLSLDVKVIDWTLKNLPNGKTFSGLVEELLRARMPGAKK